MSGTCKRALSFRSQSDSRLPFFKRLNASLKKSKKMIIKFNYLWRNTFICRAHTTCAYTRASTALFYPHTKNTVITRMAHVTTCFWRSYVNDQRARRSRRKAPAKSTLFDTKKNFPHLRKSCRPVGDQVASTWESLSINYPCE